MPTAARRCRACSGSATAAGSAAPGPPRRKACSPGSPPPRRWAGRAGCQRARPGPGSRASAGSRRRCGSCSLRPTRASRWPTRTTMVCRCEEVTLGEVEMALADGGNALGSVKRAYAGRDGPLPGPLLRAAAGGAAGRADRAGAGRVRLLRAAGRRSGPCRWTPSPAIDEHGARRPNHAAAGDPAGPPRAGARASRSAGS